MIKNLKIYIISLIAVLGFLATPGLVLASPATDACDGIKAAGGTCDTSGGNKGIEKIVTTVIDVLSFIVGAVAVIMIIIGGFRYVISGGDSAGVTGAKNTILYAIIGLVVVLFAQVIVSFVYSSTTQAPEGGKKDTSQTEEATQPKEDAAQ